MARQRPHPDPNKDRLDRMHPEVLNVAGAARVLGVSTKTILNLARKGVIPAKKVGKEWRFRLQTLLRWLGDGTTPSSRTKEAQDTVAALGNMGYSTPQAEAMVDRASLEFDRRAPADALLKEALKHRP